jgi:hypothetical protein
MSEVSQRIVEMQYSGTVHIGELQNQPRCPSTDERVKKTWCTHNGLFFTHKEEQNYVICREVEIMLSEINQTEKTSITSALSYAE